MVSKFVSLSAALLLGAAPLLLASAPAGAAANCQPSEVKARGLGEQPTLLADPNDSSRAMELLPAPRPICGCSTGDVRGRAGLNEHADRLISVIPQESILSSCCHLTI
jgi:hypothetical protein